MEGLAGKDDLAAGAKKYISCDLSRFFRAADIFHDKYLNIMDERWEETLNSESCEWREQPGDWERDDDAWHTWGGL